VFDSSLIMTFVAIISCNLIPCIIKCLQHVSEEAVFFSCRLSSQIENIKMSAQHSNGTKGWRAHDSQLCKNLSQDCISAVDEPTETAIQISFPCNICGKSFKRKAKLNEHINRHIGRRPHICEICGKRFTERSSLKIHALSHTGQKMHVCDMCGKRFLLLTQLKAHALIHSGQKLHVCDVCGKRFTQLGALRMHSFLHTGEKPFSCNLCGKSFAQKNTLKIHIGTHTGQKPYVCSICSKSFSQRAHLKTHTIVHSGQKRFCCHICGTSFTRKHNLKKHAARHGDHWLLCSRLYQGCPALFGKGPQSSLWSGSRAVCVKITISRISNCLNFCIIHIVCMYICIIYKCGLGPHNSVWWPSGWTRLG